MVFIGNLAWGTTEEGLRAFASSVGPVLSVQIQTHADTGRSKGWGYVDRVVEALGRGGLGAASCCAARVGPAGSTASRPTGHEAPITIGVFPTLTPAARAEAAPGAAHALKQKATPPPTRPLMSHGP